MPSRYITLSIQTRFIDLPATLLEGKRVPINIRIDKLIDLLIEEFPRKGRKQCRQELAIFLEYVGEAGNEGSLMREYLSDLIKMRRDYKDLPQALSNLTGKDLLTIKTNVWVIEKWTKLAITIMAEPRVTRLVIAILVFSHYKPEYSLINESYDYIVTLFKN